MFSHRTILSPIGLRIYMAGVTPRNDMVSVFVWDDGTENSRKDETRNARSTCKSTSSMVKIDVSFQMSRLKRNLRWPSRSSFRIPMTISSLIFSGAGCIASLLYGSFAKETYHHRNMMSIQIYAYRLRASAAYKWVGSLQLQVSFAE